MLGAHGRLPGFHSARAPGGTSHRGGAAVRRPSPDPAPLRSAAPGPQPLPGSARLWPRRGAVCEGDAGLLRGEAWAGTVRSPAFLRGPKPPGPSLGRHRGHGRCRAEVPPSGPQVATGARDPDPLPAGRTSRGLRGRVAPGTTGEPEARALGAAWDDWRLSSPCERSNLPPKPPLKWRVQEVEPTPHRTDDRVQSVGY